jgi:hypothetical protein
MKHRHSSVRCVPMSDTCRVRHRHDTDTYNYTELCDFLKLLAVSACRCPCCIRCPCPYPCFIGSKQGRLNICMKTSEQHYDIHNKSSSCMCDNPKTCSHDQSYKCELTKWITLYVLHRGIGKKLNFFPSIATYYVLMCLGNQVAETEIRQQKWNMMKLEIRISSLFCTCFYISTCKNDRMKNVIYLSH